MKKYIVGIVISLLLLVLVYAIASSNARIVNLHENHPEISFFGGGTKKITKIKFGEVSDYVSLGPGDHTIQITSPKEIIWNKLYNFKQSQKFNTFVVTNEKTYLIVEKSEKVSKKWSKISMLHASKNTPKLDVLNAENGDYLIEDVSYGEYSGYERIVSGEYNIEIRDNEGLPYFDRSISLQGGTVYTLIVYGESENLQHKIIS